MTNPKGSDAERALKVKNARAEHYRREGITAVYDRLHKGKLGAHWLWCVIERIGLGHGEAEVMQEYGYYEPGAARAAPGDARPEAMALAFPHTADFSETKCPHCDTKFYIEREKSLECTRSHPHENMDALCELRTVIARLENEKARAGSFGDQALQIVAELVGWIQADGEITLHNKTEWMDKALKLVLDEQEATPPDTGGVKPMAQGLSEVTGVARQVCDMGLKVGDTIIGRESGNGYGGYWHEAKLTLLWVGSSEAVWLERERSDNNPEWSEPEESTAWTLDCREWKVCAAHNIKPPSGAMEGS